MSIVSLIYLKHQRSNTGTEIVETGDEMAQVSILKASNVTLCFDIASTCGNGELKSTSFDL